MPHTCHPRLNDDLLCWQVVATCVAVSSDRQWAPLTSGTGWELQATALSASRAGGISGLALTRNRPLHSSSDHICQESRLIEMQHVLCDSGFPLGGTCAMTGLHAHWLFMAWRWFRAITRTLLGLMRTQMTQIEHSTLPCCNHGHALRSHWFGDVHKISCEFQAVNDACFALMPACIA